MDPGLLDHLVVSNSSMYFYIVPLIATRSISD